MRTPSRASISPQAVLGNFNEFARSVVLRISERKDLGDIDRFAFYEATKTLTAAPPDTLRVNPKYVSPYYVLNVTGASLGAISRRRAFAARTGRRETM